MKDLFGNQKDKNQLINLNLFCDEAESQGWLYLGILIIPVDRENELIQDLLNCRCGNPAKNKIWGECVDICRHHAKNNTHIHFKDIHKAKDKFFIAQKWIEYLLTDREIIHFYILGLDINKIDLSQFGERKQQSNIYNRFFRTAILKSVKSYFHKWDTIVIDKIYHDNNRSLETHKHFPWHPIFFISSNDEKITIKAKDVTFIDSDHRLSGSQYSHLIQFMDLVLGCAHNCLHHTSKDNDKEIIALQSLKLIQRIIDKPNNRNSQYNYVGRQKIEFFPKYDFRNLNESELERENKRMSAFYTGRHIKIKDRNQITLFN